MPRLWSDTIESHRHQVREAILETTAALVAADGVLSVTMSRIAKETGVGRATLYKYFRDVEAILFAWHEREISRHLAQLVEVRDQADPDARLDAVLETYAVILHQTRRHHDSELAAVLHRHGHVVTARHRVRELLCDLLAEAAASGEVRDDVAPDELAVYCVHALSAASGLRSPDAVHRLVAVAHAGLRPQP